MLRASIGFFIVGIVAYVLGAGGIAGLSVEIGRTLLLVFFVLSLISFLFSFFRGKGSSTL